MKVIDKLGRKLAKDFNKMFESLNEDQLKILQNTKMYQLFANKTKGNLSPYEQQIYKPRSSSSTDLDHIKTLEIMTKIANDKLQDDTVRELLDSKESSNIIIAANIANNKYK
jgi:hypothetical protein